MPQCSVDPIEGAEMVASMNMILAAVAIAFVVATIAWLLYVLIRPATHVHYEHPADKLWRPLD